jgi:hypothetical protein
MLEAYCWPRSVAPGEPVGLHLSTDASAVDIEVAREGVEREIVWSASGSQGVLHPTPDDAAENGCAWPSALQIPTETRWRSGYYSVSVTAGDERAAAFLVVRPKPGAASPILLALSTATWDAYNDWGGPSLYTGGTRVSLERPMARGFLEKPERALRKAQSLPNPDATTYIGWARKRGLSDWSGGAGWWNWERPFLAWAERTGFAIDVALSDDLEAHPEILDGHRLFVSVGHDEYWSWRMRDAVDGFLARGGNAAIFSGNTCFWQVRFDDERRAMTCFKYRADEDPVIGTPDERFVTSAWVDRRIGRPELSTIGLSFSRAGYARYGNATPRSSGAYTMWRPEHWAFEGTGLAYGDALGLADTIVGYEVDGCEIAIEEGRPVPTHADGAPASLEILASAPAHLWDQTEQPSRYAHEPGELENVAMAIHGGEWRANVEHYRYGHAVIGAFTLPGGGTVFNAGCTDWAYGLGDPDVARITRNVLARLSI